MVEEKQFANHAKKCASHLRYIFPSRGKCDCDGYHTFAELYDHRIELWIALCKSVYLSFTVNGVTSPIWRTKVHSDGSSFDGLFVLGMYHNYGTQITYHLPMSRWKDCEFAVTLEKAPVFDGHTSDDVIKRLKDL